MARLNVNPTRMVLSNLKKQLRTAVRGHKLMKDKRDELMKRFLELARENKRLREEVEAQLMEVYGSFSIASAVMTPQMMEEALMYPKQSVSLAVGSKNIMSVDVPVFDFETSETEIFPRLLQLAAMEKEASMLSDEIEKTRRRVNALEYVKIPQYEETIRYITMKLDEDERGNQTRLMKVKDLMLKEAIEERQEQDRESRAEYDRAHACQ